MLCPKMDMNVTISLCVCVCVLKDDYNDAIARGKTMQNILMLKCQKHKKYEVTFN